jgi:hypothetical protein
MCTRIKSCTPMILKDDYIGCKDYNLMKSFSKCLYNLRIFITMSFVQFQYVLLVIYCIVRSG